MTPASLEAAAALVRSAGLAAFSVDVFDTFLLRRTTGPEGVYERAFAHAPVPEGRRRMAESYVQQRIIAEHKARQIAWKLHGRAEVTIDEIYDQFALTSFGLDAGQRPALVEAEFQAELDLCLVNRDILALHDEARQRGLRTGFLSDTYWPADRLSRLLRHAAPDLAYDFLYASCDHGVGKAGGLFATYLAEQGLAADQAGHIGDNPAGDVAVPRALGVMTIHYPQAAPALTAIFQREAHMIQALAGQGGSYVKRLDGGLQVMRRLTAESGAEASSVVQATGAAVLGPVMLAFRNFVRARLAELKARSGEIKLLFIARDGYLPFQLWDQAAGEEAFYVEINRRVVLVGSADGIEPFQALFRAMRQVDGTVIEGVLKTHLPAVADFFAARGGAAMPGADFAEIFPTLVDADDIRPISGAVRDGLIFYLRRTVRGFDDATDIVIVDLGYSGTVQRGLRGVFDRAGLADKRIHGIYLATIDENYAQIPPADSASGFLDDYVMTPMAKRVLLRNIAVLEQFCSAPVGSVYRYDAGEAVREEEMRPAEQLRLCGTVRDACLRFADAYDAKSVRFGLDPLRDGLEARLWCAAILCRFLLLPRLEERELFGKLRQDVNLGSRTLVDMIDVRGLELLMGAMPLDQLNQASEPPMWLAGGLAALSPLAGYAYAYTAFGLVGADLAADAGAGRINAVLIRDGAPETIAIGCAVTASGAIRLRIPVLRKHGGAKVAVPLDPLFRHGIIVAAVMQDGDSSAEALRSRRITPLPADSIQAIGADCDGLRFEVTEAEGHLVVSIPAFDQKLAVVTLTIEALPPVHRNSADRRAGIAPPAACNHEIALKDR